MIDFPTQVMNINQENFNNFAQQRISIVFDTLLNLYQALNKSERSLPLPPLTEQHEIVRRVDSLFERADQIEGQVLAATRRTKALRQVVMGKGRENKRKFFENILVMLGERHKPNNKKFKGLSLVLF